MISGKLTLKIRHFGSFFMSLAVEVPYFNANSIFPREVNFHHDLAAKCRKTYK